MDFTEGLNIEQKKAVLHGDGPLLVLAGAGSGKTRVLTHRIARLVEELGVAPWNILAITFTNKAAKEMKDRLSSLIGASVNDMWVSTFHAMCVRILRREITKLGYDSNFVIYDSADQQTVIKECIKQLNISDKQYTPKGCIERIGRAKDEFLTPDEFITANSGNYYDVMVGEVYKLYQKKLKDNNALDFDDLIMMTVQLLQQYPSVLEYYQNKFRYILVDEYQDTNKAQYLLVNLLARKYKNLCVVGDDDQSIYGWRGADVTNILDFEKDYADCTTIKLEQNYRSTPSILSAANSVIKNNKGRKVKELWTANDELDKPVLCSVDDAYEEARYVAGEIEKSIRDEEYTYSDCAILYRTNAQSRAFEDIFMREAIPYKIFGGLKFYDRKEIKDCVSYLRTILNPYDNVSLSRIINVPKRGIGATSIERVAELATQNECSLYEIISHVEEYPELARAATKFKSFAGMIKGLRVLAGTMTVSALFQEVLDVTGIIREYEAEKTEEANARIDNIKELKTVAIEFERQAEDEDGDCSLEAFLAQISLVSDIDSMEADSGAVTLMTMHSAKGLEFPVVFLVGMEDGIFPSYRSLDDAEKLEEERRLAYVGITRAMKKLFITNAFARTMYGKTERYNKSRFLDEIPETILNVINMSSNRNYFASEPVTRGFSGVGISPKKPVVSGFGKVDTSKNAGAFGVGGISKGFGASQPKKLVEVNVGDKVSHPKFGVGIVSKLSGEPPKQMVEINFEQYGMRRLMLAFANLTKAE